MKVIQSSPVVGVETEAYIKHVTRAGSGSGSSAEFTLCHMSRSTAAGTIWRRPVEQPGRLR